ncbi:MAG: hypothetical protein J6V98_05460 [Bacteroidales bacterium]|nr:hypothetical protein [Bacteroidales bacterium]
MIDNTELMILDWVSVKGKPMQVVGIEPSVIVFGCGRRVSRRKVKPLPITAKFLLKNGFEQKRNDGFLTYLLEFKDEELFDGNGKCLFPKYIEMRQYGDLWCLHSEYGIQQLVMPLRYIHNLQHIMLDSNVYHSLYV